jgi:Flp pilus assembly protein TadG
MTGLFNFFKRSRGWGLWKSRRGNVALITAFMVIPLSVALGTAYDFTMAENRQDQIDGMADIATLAGVTPAEMGQPYTTAEAYTLQIFTSQLATVNGVTYNAANISQAGGGDTASGATVNRIMEINYTAASTNVFAGLVGMPTFPLKGGSQATSSTAPNIDFYLMLDTSPSMEIAATSTGIATMIANTQQESDPTSDPDTWPYGNPGIYDPSGAKFAAAPNGNGCAFGCHQSEPADLTSGTNCVSHIDPAGSPTKPTTACQFLTQTYQKIPCTTSGVYSDGTTFTTSSTFPETGRDNYDLSRCLGVVLRSDLVNTAAQNLMTTAAATELNNNAKYRMAIFETDYNNQANPLNLYALQGITADLSLAKSQAATVEPLEVCYNNDLVCGTNNNDEDTDLDDNLVSMNTATNAAYIPAPGQGTNNIGDTPQEVLFIVTDGQNDYNSGGRVYPPMDLNATRCAAIRNRGIRIAVLYTVYMPLENDWWQQAVSPYLGYTSGDVPYLPASSTVTDKIASAATTCASPGLYYQVSTDGDISAALNHLFQEAIATARLLH